MFGQKFEYIKDEGNKILYEFFFFINVFRVCEHILIFLTRTRKSVHHR